MSWIRRFDLEKIKRNTVEYTEIPLKKENLQLLIDTMKGWGYFIGDDPDHPDEPDWNRFPPKTIDEFKRVLKHYEYRTPEDSITIYRNCLLGFVIGDDNDEFNEV